ncbi:50S ribosomal protein L6 [Blochmannia endosymbiont of Camponotus sp.]|uniref:50S ribosomal protein L6 n=1 Tax=Blochmannia endosymbiont of Camponotus sp. TaxID=700220 RepID=UPI0020240DB2|nr:50S ribosomal protein L6 [Blochmannia endosymbiont of Camponotus sp.]URJ30165.1 50S ribosomal protein L6 [Blochmannia endosymbiont of Camponotus sp.]URJ30941.1 50S ribosomal protein L6 [Blochmannia endosymbiont of Camponotus sp.]
MYPDTEHISTSHVYKTIILIPNIITIKLQDHCIYVTGTLGTSTLRLHKSIAVQLHDEKKLLVYTNENINIKNKALIGTTHALINNMITGVTTGFTKKLQLIGIGYRVAVKNNIINLTIGFSHSINYTLPVEITAICPSQTEITITGINKQIVGQIAADLRSLRPPEPFKGKGIRYINEIIHNKDTKKR